MTGPEQLKGKSMITTDKFTTHTNLVRLIRVYGGLIVTECIQELQGTGMLRVKRIEETWNVEGLGLSMNNLNFNLCPRFTDSCPVYYIIPHRGDGVGTTLITRLLDRRKGPYLSVKLL